MLQDGSNNTLDTGRGTMIQPGDVPVGWFRPRRARKRNRNVTNLTYTRHQQVRPPGGTFSALRQKKKRGARMARRGTESQDRPGFPQTCVYAHLPITTKREMRASS
ncbi:PREDICTED: uncharacterized protein LOC106750046 [Dinoponera quadriceps]|uniref:Uncharacterized protein LOC106750046 n=1 Tax=Dinoponera quadriceps TaxID=609295 RepID=A0A6P3Y695_DINQU|nr:PREDICTED: uncharacterized protein LOC106750046 [Dinoponera quadriceps]